MPTLQAEKIVATTRTLARRVEERFPGRGLSKVAAALVSEAEMDAERAAAIARPFYLLRAGVALLIAGFLAVLGYGLWTGIARWDMDGTPLEVFQGVEAVVNLLILLGAGIWFLLNVETRAKRRRVLDALHELRSLAHVIDMHQLAKDPYRLRASAETTQSSPSLDLTPFQLSRYLDYCSEMLSLVAKLAALYLAQYRDPVAIAAVDGIQDLTSSLSRKIWQKIALIEGARARGPAMPPTAVDSESGEDAVNKAASPLHPFALGD